MLPIKKPPRELSLRAVLSQWREEAEDQQKPATETNKLFIYILFFCVEGHTYA